MSTYHVVITVMTKWNFQNSARCFYHSWWIKIIRISADIRIFSTASCRKSRRSACSLKFRFLFIAGRQSSWVGAVRIDCVTRSVHSPTSSTRWRSQSHHTSACLPASCRQVYLTSQDMRLQEHLWSNLFCIRRKTLIPERTCTAVCQKLTNKYDTQQAGSSAFRLVLYIATVFISSNYAADGTAIYIK